MDKAGGGGSSAGDPVAEPALPRFAKLTAVAVVNGEKHHGLRCVPFSSDYPNVMLHLSVVNAPHLLGRGGGMWRGVSSTWMRRAVMNHFFFNCWSAMRRNFSTVDAPAVFGMHLIKPLF